MRFTPASAAGQPWRLAIHDTQGRLVRVFGAADRSPGERPLVWDRRGADGRRVPAGVYFYRFSAPGGESVGKVSVVR